jgi:AraC-like DNA-binding protein/mannose-6-phosphate isomerase-like protein (cupin superfamily)
MRTEKTYNYADVTLENGSKVFLRASDENSYSLSGNKNTSRMHSHSFSELCLVTHGTAKCLCNYTSRIVSKGDLLIIDPNVQHDFVETSDFTCYTIGLDGVRFFTNESNFITKTEKSFSTFQSIFKIIVDEARSKENKYDTILLNALNMLSVLLARRRVIDKVDTLSSNMPKLNNGVMVAKTYIDTYYSREISLNSLCEIAYISPQHLIRQFKALTGYTPKQYLNRIRIQVAAGAILDSYDSIKTIATSVGYGDYQAFLYTFKQFVGISPQQFREDYKNNSAEGRKLISFVSPENIASLSSENTAKQ